MQRPLAWALAGAIAAGALGGCSNEELPAAPAPPSAPAAPKDAAVAKPGPKAARSASNEL